MSEYEHAAYLYAARVGTVVGKVGSIGNCLYPYSINNSVIYRHLLLVTVAQPLNIVYIYIYGTRLGTIVAIINHNG